ncbi:MAG: hypothetical protein IID54_05125, partial [Proteobacteria bacterium]|nr:hypothetical protein [Pseudomonadota bacterium]
SDSTALLIDQDGCVGASNAVAQISDQAPGLGWVPAIARKKNEAEGLGSRVETPLRIRQLGAGAAEDYSLDDGIF